MLERDILLLTHFLGLIIGAGSGFALFVISFLSPRFPVETRRAVILALFPLRYISYIGLAILIISGLSLTLLFYPLWATNLYFQIKLASVAALVLISLAGLVLMHRLRKGGPDHDLRRLGLLGKIGFALSLIAVGCAVRAFH